MILLFRLRIVVNMTEKELVLMLEFFIMIVIRNHFQL